MRATCIVPEQQFLHPPFVFNWDNGSHAYRRREDGLAKEA